MLTQRFDLVHLSTGDLLREAVAAGTEAGLRAKAVMDAGDLVCDEIVTAILADRLDRPDTGAGIVLDGFPRTATQAAALDDLLADRGRRIDAAISLRVDDAAMIARVAGRFTCASCGEGYHDTFKRPRVSGVCDGCGATGFKRRSDDTAETAGARLAAYHAQTQPLIDFYRGHGVLAEIDAMGPIDGIAQAMSTTVARLASR